VEKEAKLDKSIAGLIGVAGALAVAAPSQAATAVPLTLDAAMQASSYADLLRPIPNALALLQTAAAAEAAPGVDSSASEGQATVQQVQYYHHHHHHHRYRRRYHHHHHHHNYYYR